MEGPSMHNLFNFGNFQLNVRNRYALIVVGKMNHRKSSFCRMLMDKIQRQNVKVNFGIGSDTRQCLIYKSTLFSDIFHDGLYVVDTPGVNSKDVSMFIVEKINKIIQEEQLSIVGIAYVLDIKDKEVNQDGKSHIFKLLDLLRVRYCHKSNLAFCVLTKFDRYYQDEEENESAYLKFENLFKVHSYEKMWQSKIQWMNEPVKDKNKYENKIKNVQEVKKIYQKQFPRLRQFFSNILNNKLYLAYDQFRKDIFEFQSIFSRRIVQDYKQFQLQAETKTGQFTITIAYKKRAILSGLFGVATLPIALAVLGAAVIGLGINLLLPEYKSQKSVSINFRDFLSKMHQDRVKLLLLGQAFRSAKVQGCDFTCIQLPFMNDLKCFNKNNQQIQVKKVTKQNVTTFYCELQLGANKMVFQYKMLSIKAYEQYLIKLTNQFFKKKE